MGRDDLGRFGKQLALATFCITTLPATADEARLGFVEANILSIFYHELGHAVIDVMDVPIFGQEEDAADVMAVLLIDWLYDEESAQSIAYDSAFGYISDPEQVEEVAYWDLHGPDLQRYYNHVCLFYGANPDERDDVAEELGLPEERAETCPEEYDQAANSWGQIFDEIEDLEDGTPIKLLPGGEGGIIHNVLSREIADMAQDITFPVEVNVTIEACQEANAFYDPGARQIIFCLEFVDELERIYDTTFEG